MTHEQDLDEASTQVEQSFVHSRNGIEVRMSDQEVEVHPARQRPHRTRHIHRPAFTLNFASGHRRPEPIAVSRRSLCKTGHTKLVIMVGDAQ
jgi:hypothetical protein